MGRDELSNAQLRGLQYVDHKPAFLQRLINGPSDKELSASGARVPIPERPGGPADEDTDEDDPLNLGEEAPSVVVLKEGKHLSVEEARQEQRRAKGLPDESRKPDPEPASKVEEVKKRDESMTFGTSTKQPPKKRKAVAIGQASDEEDAPKATKPATKKRPKQGKTGGLSFA